MFSDLRALSLPRRRLPAGLFPAIAAIAGLSGSLLLSAAPAEAQQAGYGQTLGTSPMERQIYDGGTGRPNSGSILDSTNPLDLMNKIRRGTAMDEATPPSSAIDQALQQFEAQAPAPTASTTAGGVSGSPSQSMGRTPAAAPQSPSGSASQRQAL